MERVLEAVAARDVNAIMHRVFQAGTDQVPFVRTGFRRETEAWDFKAGLPGLRATNECAWAEIAADLLAFHNQQGGVVFFGVSDKNFEFVGTRDVLDAKRFNDKVRRYLGDKVWVDFSREYIQEDQRYLGVAVIQKRGLVPLRMRADAPPRPDGSRLFGAGDLCVRIGDETRIFRGGQADAYLATQRLPSPDAQYLVREANARILRPDWDEFLRRDDACNTVEKGLKDERTYVTALSGVGGMGKTALACWAVLRAYEEKRFDFIVSVSAKDRELTSKGIRPTQPNLTSFDDLLNQTLEVLGFSDGSLMELSERETLVRDLIKGVRVLLFVDNLETVEDKRVIQFLETLPLPVKAITTSRVASVKTAAYPISVGPLTLREAVTFFERHATRHANTALRSAARTEKERLVEACSRVPLAIEWLIGQSRDVESASSIAAALAGSGKRDEELLEFCFRRVHSDLPDSARAVLAALSLDDKPQTIEALGIACNTSLDSVEDALATLEACSLVERVWDDKIHDFASKTLPMTRRFAYRELQRRPGEEVAIRNRLSGWYEGRDVPDEAQRALVVQIRQGSRDPDALLVDAAIAYRREGKIHEAETYFRRAIERNARSWRAHRELAELLRDQQKVGAALEEYRLAIRHAPNRGQDRALIFREYGMLVRRSGIPTAQEDAITAFETARRETPNDAVLLHALASCYVRLGQWRKAEPILETLVASPHPDTRHISYDLLEKCYRATSETLKLAELSAKRRQDESAPAASTRGRTVQGSSRPLTKPRRR